MAKQEPFYVYKHGGALKLTIFYCIVQGVWCARARIEHNPTASADDYDKEPDTSIRIRTLILDGLKNIEAWQSGGLIDAEQAAATKDELITLGRALGLKKEKT